VIQAGVNNPVWRFGISPDAAFPARRSSGQYAILITALASGANGNPEFCTQSITPIMRKIQSNQRSGHMMNLAMHNNEIDSERQRAIATARMISYAATDASELGLKECSQLLIFTADLIKAKFKINSEELLMSVLNNDNLAHNHHRCGKVM
jgi:hypothetical protein